VSNASSTSDVSSVLPDVTVAGIFESVAVIDGFDHWLFSTRGTVDGTSDMPMTSGLNKKHPGMIDGQTRTPLVVVNDRERALNLRNFDGKTVSAPESTELNTTSGYSPEESAFTVWESLSRDLAPQYANTFVPVEAGLIYLTRWFVSGDSLGDQPAMRLRTGYPDAGAIGEATSELLAASGVPSGLGSIHRTYFYAHNKGLMAFGFDVEHSSEPGSVLDATLSRIEVASFKRDSLTGEMVRFYEGGRAGEDFKVLSANDVPPADGRREFSQDWTLHADGVDAPMASVTPGALKTEVLVAEGTSLLTWTGPEMITVPSDKLVVMDVWLSSPDGALEEGDLQTRLSLTNTGSGRIESFTFDPRAGNPAIGDEASTSAIPVGSQSRRYTVILDPQTVGADAVEVLPMIELLASTAGESMAGDDLLVDPVDARHFDEGNAPTTETKVSGGRMQIDAVVITTYDLPAEFREEGPIGPQ
jgi:hypothetical protein